MRGYIALLSVLVMSGILFVVTISAGITVYFASQDVRGEVEFRQSRAAAFSCAQLVIHAVSVDSYRFASDTPTMFPVSASSTCIVESVSVWDQEVEAVVTGVTGGSSSQIRVYASRFSSSTAFNITHLEE
jgi:hypothetical protein